MTRKGSWELSSACGGCVFVGVMGWVRAGLTFAGYEGQSEPDEEGWAGLNHGLHGCHG